jgi:CHASE2 domain-containing sensor protein
MVDNRVVPVDGRSDALVRYRGKKRPFPYVSTADVLSSHVPAGILQGKIVFVGTTALGTREVVATPGYEVIRCTVDEFVAETLVIPLMVVMSMKT